MIAKSSLAITALFLCILQSSFAFPFIGHFHIDAPSIKLVDVQNNIYDISKMDQKPILLIFFDPQNARDKETISYAEVLFRRYHSRGLCVFGISKKNTGSTFELFVYGGYSFPFISDQNNTIHAMFNIKGCCGGIVLINREKKVIFNLPYLLDINNLRQLIEKEILGKIQYSFSFNEKDKEILLREELPELPLMDIHTYRVTNIMHPRRLPIVMTFFSSFCPDCKSSGRIQTLKKLKAIIDSNKYEVRIILVFFKPYNERDIQGWDNTINMPFEKYIALKDIYSDDEKYVTDASLKTDPLTVVLDSINQFLFVERPGMEEAAVLDRVHESLSPGGLSHEIHRVP